LEIPMKSKALSSVARSCMVVVVVVAGALAQAQNHKHFSGIINDFTPEHSVIPSGASGPWELHGNWRLHLKEESGLANFSATLTMEDSDYWLIITPNPPANPDAPATRTPHTHHVSMEDAQVIWLDSTNASDCPTSSYKPATVTGFMVKGLASVTANGGFAPFAPQGQRSPLQICITGGSQVEFSNITLVFGAPASEHFGTQPINGAVREPRPHREDDLR
jgi:hypothetical protein